MHNYLKKSCLSFLAMAMVASAFLAASQELRPMLTNEERILQRVERLHHEREMQARSQEIGEELDFAQDGENEALNLQVASIQNDFVTKHDAALHKLKIVSIFGDYVTLDDGIKYKVNSKDADKVLNWLLSDRIIILPPSIFSSYDYILLNTSTGAKVEVKQLEPLPGQMLNAYTILGVDYAQGRIALQDGSIWNVYWFDGPGLKRWFVGDMTTIGVNDGYFTKKNYANILINVNINEYVRANCSF